MLSSKFKFEIMMTLFDEDYIFESYVKDVERRTVDKAIKETTEVRQLQAAVRQVKASREWEVRFVIFEEMLQEQREAGKAEGRAEGKAEDILILLEGLPDKVPEDLREYLFSEKDSDVLHRYLKLAASASSVGEFAQLIRQ